MTDLSSNGSNSGRVLVVDDQAPNRLLLRDPLESRGYLVEEAVDGGQALEQVAAFRPDVVLLDVMMPVLDGYEVCRRLKANPATAPIPVIMITSLSDRRERLEGIGAGANDFLTKPIDITDVLLRVRNAVETKHLYNQLQTTVSELRRAEAMRDSLTNMIVHDLRSPLCGVMGHLELLEFFTRKGDAEKTRKSIEMASTAANMVNEMVTSLLDVSRLEAGEMPLDLAPHDLREIAETAMQPFLSGVQATRAIEMRLASEPVIANCDRDIIRRVIANFVSNAVKFSPSHEAVRVQVAVEDGKPTVSVRDRGPGIPPELHDKVFEKFGQLDEGRRHVHSTGLGLAFCKLALEAHGGGVDLVSAPGAGSTFSFVLAAA